MTVVDTTYLLPLARIQIQTDLLAALAEERIPRNRLNFEEIQISSVSIFELQAKAAKLKVNPEYVVKAIEEISKTFTVEPYYSSGVVKIASDLKAILSDYIDCVIVATAIELKTNLITEDSRIRKNRDTLNKKYGVEILTYLEVLQGNQDLS